MKIVSEVWAGDDTLIVTGFHLDPAKYVVRIHRKGRSAQTIEFTEPEQMQALIEAATALMADGRTPRQVADEHGVREGEYTWRKKVPDLAARRVST